MGVSEHQSSASGPILTSPTIFHFIRMSEFSLLKGVTVVILVTFRKIGLSFSVCNISKNYTWYIDTWKDIYKICQSGFFSSPVSLPRHFEHLYNSVSKMGAKQPFLNKLHF